MSADHWVILGGLIVWGGLLILIIALCRAAGDQDRNIDEANSRYLSNKKDDLNV